MNALGRSLLLAPEALVYGPSYGYIQYLIRSPKPLDPEFAWKAMTVDHGPAANWIRTNWPPAFVRPLLLAAKMRQDHVLGISAHYDVSNEFYELFLDKKYMFYTCSDYHFDTKTLEEAQTNKANFILNLLDPKPGERILELGCGWGAMLKRIYEHTGDKQSLHGYTLSREQVIYNEQHNGFNVEFKDFITTDYPAESFDKIYSIGAWEHVRVDEVQPLLNKLYRALKPGGRLVQHFFCPLSTTLPAACIVGQIFFPGSRIAALPLQLKYAENAGFRISHRSLHDYRPTCRAWFDNLVANRERALQLVDVHTYNKYLLFFGAAWRYFDDYVAVLIRMRLDKVGV